MDGTKGEKPIAKRASRGNFGDFIIMYVKGEITDEDIRKMKARYRLQLATQSEGCETAERPVPPVRSASDDTTRSPN